MKERQLIPSKKGKLKNLNMILGGAQQPDPNDPENGPRLEPNG